MLPKPILNLTRDSQCFWLHVANPTKNETACFAIETEAPFGLRVLGEVCEYLSRNIRDNRVIPQISQGIEFDKALESMTPGYVPSPTGYTRAQTAIVEICEQVKTMLLDKNRKYGNSALEPKRIFSKAPTLEQINVRIDDKLSRIANAQSDDDEDPEWDLLGYLILKLAGRKLLNKNGS